MKVYRIADCAYINDLSGKGAALHGGRWNSKDVYVVYTAESPALALLEAVVHIGRIPVRNYCMLTLEIPADKTKTVKTEQLPANWHSNPAPDILRKWGDEFVEANKYLALLVPSVIMPEEHNFLLNPGHLDFRKIKITGSRTISIDDRLLSSKGTA